MKKLNITLNKLLIGAGLLTFFIFVYSVVWWNKQIDITGQEPFNQISGGPKSSLTGLACQTYTRRPIAVMLASDVQARPLSGLGQADIVFEMPVTPDGVTRFMALFQCESPDVIGSVRSARADFIPLAKSFDAIYAHWGGERDTLESLNSGIINNIDALKYEGDAFYRIKGIKPPHNGFTSTSRLLSKAQELNYSQTNTFSGYPRGDDTKSRNVSNIAENIILNYSQPYNVAWSYDAATKTYLRMRTDTPEIDKNTNKQIAASVVIVMKTTSSVLRDQYIHVDVTGQGDAQIYQNGTVTEGSWVKDASNLGSKLYFRDSSGKEIKLTPGKIWVEIITE